MKNVKNVIEAQADNGGALNKNKGDIKMLSKQRVLIVGASPYKVVADGGEVYEGYTLHFVETETLKPSTADDGTRGYLPMRSSVPSSMKECVKSIPAVYDVSFSLRNDPKKGLIAKITQLEFVRECVLSAKG